MDSSDAQILSLLQRVQHQLQELEQASSVSQSGVSTKAPATLDTRPPPESLGSSARASPGTCSTTSSVRRRRSLFDSTEASRQRSASAGRQRQQAQRASSAANEEGALSMVHSPQQVRRRSLAAAKVMQGHGDVEDHLLVSHASGRTPPPRRSPRCASGLPRRTLSARTHSSGSSGSTHSRKRAGGEQSKQSTQTAEAPDAQKGGSGALRQTSRRRKRVATNRAQAAADAAAQAALVESVRHLPPAFQQAVVARFKPGSGAFAAASAAVAQAHSQESQLQHTALQRWGVAPPPAADEKTQGIQHTQPAEEVAKPKRRGSWASVKSAVRAPVLPTQRAAGSLHSHVRRMATAQSSAEAKAEPTWRTGAGWTGKPTQPAPFKLSASNRARPQPAKPKPRATNSAAMARLHRGLSSRPRQRQARAAQPVTPSHSAMKAEASSARKQRGRPASPPQAALAETTQQAAAPLVAVPSVQQQDDTVLSLASSSSSVSGGGGVSQADAAAMSVLDGVLSSAIFSQ